ncbi:hypothetical protein Tco_1127534 [Tanacetum coccineum]
MTTMLAHVDNQGWEWSCALSSLGSVRVGGYYGRVRDAHCWRLLYNILIPGYDWNRSINWLTYSKSSDIPCREPTMLLLGDQVKEAIEEVESVVQSYKAALPFRS